MHLLLSVPTLINFARIRTSASHRPAFSSRTIRRILPLLRLCTFTHPFESRSLRSIHTLLTKVSYRLSWSAKTSSTQPKIYSAGLQTWTPRKSIFTPPMSFSQAPTRLLVRFRSSRSWSPGGIKYQPATMESNGLPTKHHSQWLKPSWY